MSSLNSKARMEKWRVQSPEEPGFHTVISPEKSECRVARIYRLNLPRGERFFLETGDLEMHAVLMNGRVQLGGNSALDMSMDRFDSFYLPPGQVWKSLPLRTRFSTSPALPMKT